MKDKKRRIGGKRHDTIHAALNLTEERKYIIWRNNNFFLREAYKAARTNIIFSLAGKEGCRVISVSSALQSEGKSTTSVNLAMSLADMGSKVLLIDCDLRKPKISRLLEITTAGGLTDVLVNRVSAEQAAIRYREDKTLWVMSTGEIPPNPSELLASEAMQKLVESMKQTFDYILLDTPPVDVVTDALVLSHVIDGIVMVVRMGQSDRRSVAHAIDQLEYVNVKILGTIINGTDQGTGSYGYKRFGYGQYGYSRYGYGRYGYGRYGYGRYGYGYGSRPNDQATGAKQGQNGL